AISLSPLKVPHLLPQKLGNPRLGDFYSLLASLPPGRAGLTITFVMLNGIEQTKQLIHIAPYGQIVDELGAHDPMLVDQKCSPECHSTGRFHIIGLGNIMVEVSSQGEPDRPDSPFFR